MAFKFVANISRLFTEVSFLERFQAAKEAGFSYVEITTPLAEIGFSATELADAKKKADVNVVLMNGCCGSFSKKEFGLTAVPGKREALDIDFQLTLEYAKELEVERVHIMAGVNPEDIDSSEIEQTYIENLKRISTELQAIGSICQIEFIGSQTIPKYFLNSGEQAVSILKRIDHPNLQLQLDIFHLQMTEGNLTNAIKSYLNYSSYIQVSQAPGRNEPDSLGEINYEYIFKLLSELRYSGYIGLEYSPSSNTKASFEWMKKLKVK